jgi:polar amino acid transport system substrate-binding protein
MEERFRAMASRRGLITRGAALTGAAAVTMGVSPHVARAIEDPSQSKLKQILDAGKIRVGTGSTNPPWHFEDENGKLVGFDIEMAKIVAGGLFGLTQEQVLGDDEVRKHIEFVVHEADARIPDLVADKVDVNFQFMTVTAGRALQVEFTIPYYREGVGLLFLKDSPNNTRADLEGKGANISILQNVYSEEIVHRGVSDANVQQFDSVAAAIEALDSGRVDASASDLSTLAWLAKNNPDKYKVDTNGWDPNSYAASIKPGDQIFLNFLNTAIQESMVGLDFPLYKQAFSTYFGVELDPAPTGIPVEWR